MRLKFIDLFCGAGGFHLGLSEFADCVMACDINKHARKLYKANFPDTEVLKDVYKIDSSSISPYDILCAGFPCQSFSVAGKKKGFSSPHGLLFFEVVRIARETKPEYLLLENVDGIKTAQRGKAFKIIISSLQDIGYKIAYVTLNALRYGLPQNRKRVFIFGSRSKGFGSLTGEAIEIFYRRNSSASHFKDFVDITKQLSYKYYTKPTDCCYSPLRFKAVNREYLYSYRRNGTVRVAPRGICPTLMANMGIGGHQVPFVIDDWGIRKLTPKECFNLQGYPSTYKLDDIPDRPLYQIAGNSVPPVMVSGAWEILNMSLQDLFNKE